MKSWVVRFIVYAALLFVVVHFAKFFFSISPNNVNLAGQNIGSTPALKVAETTNEAITVASIETAPSALSDNRLAIEQARLQAEEATAALGGISESRQEFAAAAEQPPVDRRLTLKQIETYSAIVRGLIEVARSENNQLKQKHEEMEAQKKASSAAFSSAEQEAILEDYGQSMLVAMQAAGIELRAKYGMSVDECRFINARIYEAIPFMTLDPSNPSATSAAENDVMYRQKTKGIASVEQARANAVLLKPNASILIASVSEPLLVSGIMAPAE